MYKIIKPAWAFDYNQSSGTYSNTPHVSRFYPSYTYYNMNSYIYKNNYPAFVQNAQTGVCGQGISFYGYPNSQSQYITDYANHKAVTHVWSMAIPIMMGAPVGIFTAQFNAGIYYPPNYDTIGPSLQTNYVWYIDRDHMLKVGSTYNYGTYAMPFEIYNFGIDMTPYMYIPTVNAADPYCGHRYAMVYNSSNRSYDLFVDNTNSVLASLSENTIAAEVARIMNNTTYTQWVTDYGGAVRNYYSIGPGVYLGSNTSAGLNVYNQGNVYMSDWYGWEVSLSSEEIQAIIDYNWRPKLAAKTSSTYSPLAYCNGLTSIVIPPVENISYGTMQYCYNLKEVTMSEGTNNISSNAFYYCRNIETITIPESVNTIYCNSFYAANNIQNATISANCMVFDNLFSTGFNMHNLSFYQQPQQLIGPTYHMAGLPNIATGLPQMPVYSINATTSPITLVPINTNDAVTPASVMFTGNISDNAADSYRYSSTVVKDETAEYCTFESTSIRDHSLKATYTVNKLNTYGFNAVTVEAATAAIKGHLNNNFTQVPTLFENSWIVTNISNITSNSDVVIDCISAIDYTAFNNAAISSYTYGIPSIYRSFQNAKNVTIRNAQYVDVQYSFNDGTGITTFEDCNLVIIDSASFNNSQKPIFINCNIVISGVKPTTAAEFSDLLNQRYAFIPANVRLNDVSPDIVIRNVYGCSRPTYIDQSNIFSAGVPNNVVQGATLQNITLDNTTRIAYSPFFSNCTGNFNLHVIGNATNVIGNFITNHSGIGNIHVDVDYFSNVSHGLVKDIPLGSVYFRANTVELGDSEFDSVAHMINGGDYTGYTGQLPYMSSVDSVQIDGDTIPPYFMFAMNLQSPLITGATKIGACAFQGCNLSLSTSLPSLLNNCTYIGSHAFLTAVLPTTDLTLQGNIAPSAFQSITGVMNLNIITSCNLNAQVSRRANSSVTALTNVNVICTAEADTILVNLYNAQHVAISGYKNVTIYANPSSLQSLVINDSCTKLALVTGANNLTSFNLPRYCVSVSYLNTLTSLTDIWVNPNANLYGLPATVTVHYYDDIPIAYNSSVANTVIYGEGVDAAEISALGIYANGETVSVSAEPMTERYMPGLPVKAGREGIVCFTNFAVVPTYNVQKYTATYSSSSTYTAKVGSEGVAYIRPYNYITANIGYINPESTTQPITTLIIYGYSVARLNWYLSTNINSLREVAICSTGATVYGTRGVFTNHPNLSYLYTQQNMLNAVNAYMNCKQLKAVDLSGLTQQYLAGTNTFRNCTNLVAINVPSATAVNAIGANAFCGCTNLKSVDLSPLTNTYVVILTNAFRNCTNLKSVTFPSGLKSIATYAFYNTALKAVNVPTGCTVGTSAFPSDCVITYI